MALTIPKREGVKTKSSLVIPNRGISETKARETKTVREVGLPEHLGGGRYLVSDNPGELIKSDRSQDALPSVGTAERDHIISVALGGTSKKENLQYLATTREGRQEGKVSVEQKAINDYVSGKISLGEARLKVATKQQQIKGLTPTDKEQTWQGQIGNVIKGAIKTIFTAKPNGPLILTNQAKIASEITGKNITPKNYKEEIKKVTQEERQLIQAKGAEAVTESVAKVGTAPVRFTAGALATAATSYALERANVDGKYTPKTEAEKLLIGDGDIQRLTKQEDLYGTIARGAGVPVALIAMAVIESPFIAGTGANRGIKKILEKEIMKLSSEQLSKLGTNEIIKIANGVIRAEQKAGKLTAKQAEQGIKELSNIKVVEQPKLVIPARQTTDPTNFKTAEDYVKAQDKNVYYHGTSKESALSITNSGFNFDKLGERARLNKLSGGFMGVNGKELPFIESKGISITPDYKYANKYANSLKGSKGRGEVLRLKINGKLLKSNSDEFFDMSSESFKKTKAEGLSSIDNQVEYSARRQEILNKMILDKGYVAVEPDYKYLKSIGDKEPEIKILDPRAIEVLPSKSQLISEWNKAQKAPKLKYEPIIAQPSVPNRIKNEAIEKGIKADFQGIEEYDKVSFKDQAEKVGQIIDDNPEKAINIALGKELPTNGALPESVFIAVKNQAIKKGDTELLIKLATEEGGVAKESTVLGQRIKMLDEQLEDDAFRNINQVVKARRARLEKGGISVPKAKKAEVNKIKSEVAKAKPKKDEWIAFIDELTC